MGLDTGASLCYGFYIDNEPTLHDNYDDEGNEVKNLIESIEGCAGISYVKYGWDGYILAVQDSIRRVYGRSNPTDIINKDYAVKYIEWDDLLHKASIDLNIQYWTPQLILSWEMDN